MSFGPGASTGHTDVVSYGPDAGTEDDFHLLGDLQGKRVLELGCGTAQRAIAFARRGATAIGVDFSPEMIDAAKRLCERERVRVEIRQSDLADLAFLRADSVDLVVSVYALSYCRDVERVFRQAHRVLKVGAPLVFSLRHPVYAMFDDTDSERAPVVANSYFDRSAVTEHRNGEIAEVHHHTVADLLVGLVRSGYRIDTVLEPEPGKGSPHHPRHQAFACVPQTLIVRARTEGF
ncbi:MAG: class I SAM-dependent methyltransferase [Actinomycetota bacterium]|nr:class I SAM-dependent methyltransferase [Actinomycetota bacterium]MDQ3574732.1 class I SAM-dependent methyltransferase [Actinomycetota bacterium]